VIGEFSFSGEVCKNDLSVCRGVGNPGPLHQRPVHIETWKIDGEFTCVMKRESKGDLAVSVH
jgi:hypothetical protein